MVDSTKMVEVEEARAGALMLIEEAETTEVAGGEEKARGRKVMPLDVAIARLLRTARLEKKRTVTECAELVGTTRRRYGAIEKGEAPLGAAEMLVLTRFLGVPPQRVWQIVDGTQSTVEVSEGDAASGTVVVRILPGQTVTLTVGDRQEQ